MVLHQSCASQESTGQKKDFTTNLHPQANATRSIAGRLIFTNPELRLTRFVAGVLFGECPNQNSRNGFPGIQENQGHSHKHPTHQLSLQFPEHRFAIFDGATLRRHKSQNIIGVGRLSGLVRISED
jgi:hypothetical protein